MGGVVWGSYWDEPVGYFGGWHPVMKGEGLYAVRVMRWMEKTPLVVGIEQDAGNLDGVHLKQKKKEKKRKEFFPS